MTSAPGERPAARALCLQHVAAEGPAAIAPALAARGVETVVHRCDLDPEIPALDGFAAVVVMGGPQSAYADDGFPTRPAEIALLEAALATDVPVLGICLGAQLLVEAAGGRAVSGHGFQIGWGEVRFTEWAASDPLFVAVGPTVDVLHWHGDTVVLPRAAVRLAADEQYENQAFRIGDCAWGLQFHIEADPFDVEGMLAAFPGDGLLAPGGPDRILAEATARVEALLPIRDRALDRFARLAAAHARTLVPVGSDPRRGREAL